MKLCKINWYHLSAYCFFVMMEPFCDSSLTVTDDAGWARHAYPSVALDFTPIHITIALVFFFVWSLVFPHLQFLYEIVFNSVHYNVSFLFSCSGHVRRFWCPLVFFFAYHVHPVHIMCIKVFNAIQILIQIPKCINMKWSFKCQTIWIKLVCIIKLILMLFEHSMI